MASYAGSSSQPLSFRNVRFGIENEMLLRLIESPPNLPNTIRAATAHVANEYNQYMHSIQSTSRMHADPLGEYEGDSQYVEWTVTGDKSVRPSNNAQKPLELVSPIMLYGDVHWRYSVRQFWEFLDTYAYVETNYSCGTHVHISPPPNMEWNIEYLRRIAKSLIYFEPAIEVLLPPYRRTNLWAKANRADHPQFKVRTVQQALSRIDNCQNVPQLVALMNPKIRPTDEDFDRYYAWNFTNLLAGRIGTIEFRRPPGVTKVESCIWWVELACAFVQAGANFGTTEYLSSFSVDVNGLKNFLRLVLPPGTTPRDVFGRIFTNKGGSLNPVPLQPMTVEEMELLNTKTREQKGKNIIIKKMLKAQNPPR